jgi:hypothetical protein
MDSVLRGLTIYFSCFRFVSLVSARYPTTTFDLVLLLIISEVTSKRWSPAIIQSPTPSCDLLVMTSRDFPTRTLSATEGYFLRKFVMIVRSGRCCTTG